MTELEQSSWLANKCANLLIFSDDNKKMDLSLLDVGGSALVVSHSRYMAIVKRAEDPILHGQHHRNCRPTG